MDEFFTWSTLATYAGALAATMVVTQLFKDVGFIQKLPTRIFSWIVAAVIMILANLFTGTLTWGSGALSVVNAVVVSLAANGGYDFIASGFKKTK
ncbi:MAG TPA: hypothetical protein VN540_06430 [Clostridia bacterium]|nr:hypothetical protein [Clostridia bacterium]